MLLESLRSLSMEDFPGEGDRRGYDGATLPAVVVVVEGRASGVGGCVWRQEE
jgi:hypothetical protein